MSDLIQKRCRPCEGGVAPLDPASIKELLAQLDGWHLVDGMLSKTFKFRDYHESMAFVNATAWISHRENHHPDIVLLYSTCTVSYITHAIGGLSENDFICAAKIDALLKL
jgi:4a-hydroxytetrahydrobiopterin dehydratase